MINYKCWYYTEAEKDNDELRIRNIKPHDMPKDIKKIYESIHK